MSRPYTIKNALHRDPALSLLLEYDNGNHYLAVKTVTPSSITSGRKTVATAGSAVTLVVASTPCLWVEVCADLGNTNPVVVGGSGVVAANDAQAGIVLLPGNPPIRMDIDNVQKLYVDAQTNGDSICFNYYANA